MEEIKRVFLILLLKLFSYQLFTDYMTDYDLWAVITHTHRKFYRVRESNRSFLCKCK